LGAAILGSPSTASTASSRRFCVPGWRKINCRGNVPLDGGVLHSRSILTSEKRMPRDKQHPSYARKATYGSSPEEWSPSAYQGVVIVTIRVAICHGSASGQLNQNQAGRKSSGGSVHPSLMDLVTCQCVGLDMLDSLSYLFRVYNDQCPMLFVCAKVPVLGDTDSCYFPASLLWDAHRDHRIN
jgi:hypothetical protein